MKDFLAEMQWRGMIHDMTPGTQEQLNKEVTSGYIGFDPTADSLGVGNLVQIMILLHFQRCGHKPFVLIGGATGMVGDPSGKTAERQMLSKEEIQHNLDCQRKQLEQFLDFKNGENKAEIVNNYDWFKDYNFLEFIRDVGKHISVNYMLAKDSVKTRLETGMSFTEFSYQLVQGYDFYYLNQHKNCKLQMGGSDQWGNITTGTELIRRKAGSEAYALTTPLIKKADGTKFGKSAGQNVWLSAERTSPYAFYQFWLNTADEDVKAYIKIFSIKGREDIEALIKQHDEAPHLRILQKTLAEEITIRVHGEAQYKNAVEASEILFGKSTTEALRHIDEKILLEVFEGVPQFEINKSELQNQINAIELLAQKTAIFSSNGEARRMIESNAVSINKEKVVGDTTLAIKDLINGKYILVQKGKKNYFLIKAI